VDNESSAVISLLFIIDEPALILGGSVVGCAVIFSGSIVSLSLTSLSEDVSSM